MGTWTVRVVDAGGDGVAVTDGGDGTFEFEPDFVHGGPWNVEIDVTAGGESGKAFGW